MAGNWSNEEKIQIAKTFAVLATIQKSYGVAIEAKPTLQAWEHILAGFSGGQVCNAMEAWMKQDSSMPAPADLIKIMSPAPTKITQTEFIHAKEQHALEGYPKYGYYGGIIRAYEEQEGESRNVEPIADIPLNQLVEQTKKALT